MKEKLRINEETLKIYKSNMEKVEKVAMTMIMQQKSFLDKMQTKYEASALIEESELQEAQKNFQDS
jgi:ribosomal protein L14E/L6E/L27E